jgi:hypothetical protein
VKLNNALLCAAILGGLTVISGCNREEPVATYAAPKEPAKPVAVAQESGELPSGHPPVGQSGGSGGARAARSQAAGPQWTLPAGWKQIPASGMRYAAFTITEGDAPVTLTVIPLPPSPVAANVNRWEGELGLPASKAEEVDKLVQHIDANGLHIDAVELTGPETPGKPRPGTLAAMVEHQGKTWFFKATGPADKLATQKENFRAFLTSLKFGEAQANAQQAQQPQPAPQQPQAQQQQKAQPGAKTSGLTAWTKPESWKQDETPRSMRELTFFAGPENAKAEVIVSRMGGNFGGLLANINRWRQQVGLGPVSGEKDQPVEMLQLGDGAAARYDMSGPGADGKPMRQIVVMTPRMDGVWFFKILGPGDLVEKEKGAFDGFVKSVKFAAASAER